MNISFRWIHSVQLDSRTRQQFQTKGIMSFILFILTQMLINTCSKLKLRICKIYLTCYPSFWRLTRPRYIWIWLKKACSAQKRLPIFHLDFIYEHIYIYNQLIILTKYTIVWQEEQSRQLETIWTVRKSK